MPSFDFSSLLCDEEEDYTLYSDGELSESTWHREEPRPSPNINGRDSMNGLPVQSNEVVIEMVNMEIEHVPESGYFNRLRNGELDLAAREEAIVWMLKVIAHYNFGPLCAYLSVSYLDRFLSFYMSPKSEAWMMQLLAVACLSLAAKVEEIEVPLSLDLQVAETKFVFEAKTIQRMELKVLSTLKWRMQAITPFSFIDKFLYLINGEKTPSQSVVTQSTQLILNIIKREMEYLEYRPSEIAAAVAASVYVETQTVEVDKSLQLLTDFVQKDKVFKCIEMIHESLLRRGSEEGQNSNSTPSVPHTPIDVLEITWLSYKADESSLESCSNSSHSSLGAKRRKLL